MRDLARHAAGEYCNKGIDLKKNQCVAKKADNDTCDIAGGDHQPRNSGRCKLGRCYTPNSVAMGGTCYVDDACKEGKCSSFGGTQGSSERRPVVSAAMMWCRIRGRIVYRLARAALFSMGRRMHSTGFWVPWIGRGILVAVRDLPQRRLLAVAGPVTRGLADRIPAGLMLPVIIAPAQDQPVLGPDDLRADGKARRSRLSATVGACSAPCQT